MGLKMSLRLHLKASLKKLFLSRVRRAVISWERRSKMGKIRWLERWCANPSMSLQSEWMKGYWGVAIWVYLIFVGNSRIGCSGFLVFFILPSAVDVFISWRDCSRVVSGETPSGRRAVLSWVVLGFCIGWSRRLWFIGFWGRIGLRPSATDFGRGGRGWGDRTICLDFKGGYNRKRDGRENVADRRRRLWSYRGCFWWQRVLLRFLTVWNLIFRSSDVLMSWTVLILQDVEERGDWVLAMRFKVPREVREHIFWSWRIFLQVFCLKVWMEGCVHLGECGFEGKCGHLLKWLLFWVKGVVEWGLVLQGWDINGFVLHVKLWRIK